MRRWEGGDLNFSYTKGRKLLMHSSGARRLEKRWPNADGRCGGGYQNRRAIVSATSTTRVIYCQMSEL